MNEDKALLLLSSFPNYYKSLIIILPVGKEILKVDGVIIVLLENKKLKRSNDQFEGSIFVARSNHGRSIAHDNNFGKDNSRSSYMPKSDYKDKQCY